MAMKKRIKSLFKIIGVVVVVGLALLVYTFMPMTLARDPALARGIGRGRRDPGQLPEVTLSLMKTGKMPARRSFSYRGGSWSEVGENGMAAILVRHPQATFLFDTGFGSDVESHWQTIPWLMRQLSTYVAEPTAAAQLRAHGIGPEQIRWAIISHSHWDHISGLDDFPGLEVRMPQSELDFIHARRYPGLIDEMIDRLRVKPFEFTSEPYENFDSSLDLFNDGSVVLVPLPGHTEGSTGMFVNLKSGKRYFFIGDLTWTREGVVLPAERPWLARKLVDIDDAEVRRSILRVHELARADQNLVVVPAHDRRMHEEIAEFPAVER